MPWFVPNLNGIGPRYKVEKYDPILGHNKPNWMETRSNNVVCVGLLLSCCSLSMQKIAKKIIKVPTDARFVPDRCCTNADTRAAPWNIYPGQSFWKKLDLSLGPTNTSIDFKNFR